ncbi:MAG: acetylxylan esterase [Bryobacter sp.]|nr:acetylxylan esterase [Bryobacter sp.]
MANAKIIQQRIMIQGYDGGVIAAYYVLALLPASLPAAIDLEALRLPPIGADSAAHWRDSRRAEVLRLFETQVYGRAPGKPERQGAELMERDQAALGGLATRKQVRVWFSGKNGKREHLDLLLYLPNAAIQAGKRAPIFLGMNFGGNQCVNADPAVAITKRWTRPKTNLERGACASRWEVEAIVKRGYGTATFYYGDVDPDFDDSFTNGVHALYGKPALEEWGAIAAWAWGLSRAMDYLEEDPQVDARRVALHGHSRLGKAALWAGALDPRFALVISNDSGEGGAALARRKSGERTKNLNDSFPHWFARNFRQYNEREDELPVDSHLLLALIAPRPLYVASASEDLWADPEGEFAACVAVDPLYKLLGQTGLASPTMPKPNERNHAGSVAYHLRAGKHDITLWDWEGFLDFADRWLRR